MVQGWFHVVLNVETSTAISVSLTLRKDIRRLLPKLLVPGTVIANWYQAIITMYGHSIDSVIATIYGRFQ